MLCPSAPGKAGPRCLLSPSSSVKGSVPLTAGLWGDQVSDAVWMGSTLCVHFHPQCCTGRCPTAAVQASAALRRALSLASEPGPVLIPAPTMEVCFMDLDQAQSWKVRASHKAREGGSLNGRWAFPAPEPQWVCGWGTHSSSPLDLRVRLQGGLYWEQHVGTSRAGPGGVWCPASGATWAGQYPAGLAAAVWRSD